MCNAQNGICNNFEGALAISYESYTLGLHIPDEGSQWGSSESHYWPLLGDPAPFWAGCQIALH